jgi:hypothetical protein
MLKSFLSTATLVATLGTATNAQVFIIEHNPASAITEGTENHSSDPTTYADWDVLKVDNHLENITAEPIVYQWQVLAPVDVPSGWTLHGFCDNLECRTPWASGAPGTPGLWTTGEVQTSMPLNNDTRSAFYLQVCAPKSAPNGTLTMKVRVWSGEQVDTVTFIATKDDLSGLNAISLTDQRVVIAPNPAVDQVKVFTDKTLGAKQITVVNMLGRVMYSQAIAAGVEESTIGLSNFAAGMYMVRVSDEQGNVITSRKLTKN